MHLTSWGKYPIVETEVKNPHTDADLLSSLGRATSVIGRGEGRSYGDSALNESLVLSSLHLNHMESFDETSGLLVAEAGVTLAEILDAFVPRGWFLPVTPGTKFVTLGGAIASDVHGKDHHVASTFSQHVLWFDIWTPSCGIVRCAPDLEPDLFYATAGGHGLTGLITRVAIQLVKVPSAFITQDTIKVKNLSGIMDAFEENASLPYSVAWIDCLKSGDSLGRSIFMGGRFAEPNEVPIKHRENPFTISPSLSLSVPCNFPSFALNSLSVKAFNALYYGKAPKGKSKNVVTYNTFFYPLDAIQNWNRIYGKRGFTQYQFVLPKESSPEGMTKILQEIVKSGQGSFLAVLKLFGKQPVFDGNISFPMEGYTLALDFPITEKLFPLLDRLDAMVMDYEGRHYLTKDSRMSPEVFSSGYKKNLSQFIAVKSRFDPEGIFCSLQSQRLKITQ